MPSQGQQMFELMIVRVTRTRAGRKRVKERMAAGKCVACECVMSEAKSIEHNGNRGRCPTCKSRQERALAKVPMGKRQAFLDKLIEEGRLLEPQEVREIHTKTFLSRLTKRAIGASL